MRGNTVILIDLRAHPWMTKYSIYMVFQKEKSMTKYSTNRLHACMVAWKCTEWAIHSCAYVGVDRRTRMLGTTELTANMHANMHTCKCGTVG